MIPSADGLVDWTVDWLMCGFTILHMSELGLGVKLCCCGWWDWKFCVVEVLFMIPSAGGLVDWSVDWLMFGLGVKLCCCGG